MEPQGRTAGKGEGMRHGIRRSPHGVNRVGLALRR